MGPLFSWPFHRFKEEALVANEATSLSNQRCSRLALGIRCDHLAIAPITFVVWKREHGHSNVGRTVIAKPRKANSNSVRGGPGYEISMVTTAIAFDEHHPRARITFKRTKLAQVECVSNLTCHWSIVRHRHLRILQSWHQDEKASRMEGSA